MTDTPDLRTLAAEADAIRARLDQARKVYERESDCDDMPEHANGLLLALDVTISDADRLLAHVDRLAAVLPAHRRQVLDEAAEVPVEHPTSADVIQRATIEVGAEQLRKAIRRLASAAPETAPRPRQNDETAPVVGREAAQTQRAPEAAAPDGPCTWQLPDEPGPEVTAVRNAAGGTWDREGDGWRYRTTGRVPGVVGSWRRWDGLLITEGTLTDATPADGQDGDGHG